MTSPGFEQEAARSNDLPFLIDELAAGEKEGRSPSLASASVAYVLAGGTGKLYHSAFAEKHGGGRDVWRTIAQASNERSLAQEAERARRQRREGEAVRFMDLPAVSGQNETVVDRYPKDLSPAERRRFARDLLGQLNQACTRHAGHAFPAFVEWLIPQRDELPARVEKLVRSFFEKVDATSDSLLGARMARAFAVVYAGGVLGVKAGVLP